MDKILDFESKDNSSILFRCFLFLSLNIIKKNLQMNITNYYKDQDFDINQAIKVYKPYLYEKYYNKIIYEIKEKFQIKNLHQIPVLDKILISSAISCKKQNTDFLQKIYNALFLITGQRPIYTHASRSVSQFKIYKGCYVGTKVLLTNKFIMYEFIERLAHIALPSIKNFSSLSPKSLCGRSFNIGIKDITIFSEVTNYMGMETFGLTITLIFKSHYVDSKNNEQILYLLNALDIPVYD